jgi:F-type H+-transporting ATPase subunit b
MLHISGSGDVLLWIGEFLAWVALIFVVLFKRFGTRQQSLIQIITTMLDGYAKRTEEQLQIAQENREQAARAHQEAATQIAQARDEAKQIVERARTMSQTLRKEMIEAAEQERARIVAQAREEIESERNRAVLELRARAADLVVDAAREVLERTIDAETDRQIIGQALQHHLPNGYVAQRIGEN